MKTKEAQIYLQRIQKQDTIIRNKLIERAQLADIALGTTAQMDGERVQSSGSKQKMADALDRCVDMDNEINRLIDGLVDLKHQVSDIIEQLHTDRYDVLHKMYFQFMSLDDVAAATGKSKSWASSKHGQALLDVQNILNERKKDNEHGND